MTKRRALQGLRRADALRPRSVIANAHLRNLSHHLDAVAADPADRSARRNRKQPRMLGIEVVRKVDIRLVPGIYCKLRLDRAQSHAHDRNEVLEGERYRNSA